MLRSTKAVGLLTVLLAVAPISSVQAGNSAADCAAIADRAARDQRSTAGGAGRGAAGGAIFGAIVGDSSKAAGRGALLGGVIGGVRSSSQQDDAYKRAYDRCMAGY
jgi:hypothetical protein